MLCKFQTLWISPLYIYIYTGYEKNGKVASIVQEKVSLRKMCNGNKEEGCDVKRESTADSTFFKGNKKAKNILNQNLSNSDEELVDILTNLEQSGSLFDSDISVVVSDLHLKNDSNHELAGQGSDQANGSNLSENQESEQVSQSGDSIAEYFCSKTVFNLSKKALTKTEIKVLDKGLDFAPIQKTLTEPELRKDFEEFPRRCDASGTFVMKYLRILVKHHP